MAEAEDDTEAAEVAAQLPVIQAAWRFLRPFYESGSLEQAWPNADPALRLCWAQWWLHANDVQLRRAGHDLARAADELSAENTDSPLWPHFERVVLRDFRAAFPLDPTTWGIGAAPRVLGPDTELLYVHREVPQDGIWLPGATAQVVPVVLRLGDRGWQVLNLGYDRVPQPGWPPALRRSSSSRRAGRVLTTGLSRRSAHSRFV